MLLKPLYTHTVLWYIYFSVIVMQINLGKMLQTAKIVEAFLANMEVAAELDVSANEAKEPAVHKLKMLPEVEG